MTQDEALAILKTGANVFLTGEPGSGKSYTINQYTRYLRSRGIEPAVTASTGIAATQIGGMTVHSWSGIGIKGTLNKYDLDKISSTEYIVRRVQRAKVLIIDEVSMLPPETLSMVDVVCREIRQSEDAFGGLQVILVGDFFQLPPILKNNRQSHSQISLIEKPVERFAYDSPAWKKANFMTCYLTEQHRQDDKKFFSLLTAIRENNFDSSHLRQIEKRKKEPADVAKITPKLYTHNADVDRVNDGMLSKIISKTVEYKMESRGSRALVDSLKRGCLSPEVLALKVGAEVMFTKNNQKEGFVNGTLGRVVGFDDLTRLPIIRKRDGDEIKVDTMDWMVEERGSARATITQLPLRLAWAITVHKSQGVSLDEAVMDLSQVFEFGQGYVALSRVRRLKGLHLLGWNERTFQVHPDVFVEDKGFRASSEAALEVFGKLTEEEMVKLQSDFVTICGGI